MQGADETIVMKSLEIIIRNIYMGFKRKLIFFKTFCG